MTHIRLKQLQHNLQKSAGEKGRGWGKRSDESIHETKKEDSDEEFGSLAIDGDPRQVRCIVIRD
jgi:hypothetical protein